MSGTARKRKSEFLCCGIHFISNFEAFLSFTPFPRPLVFVSGPKPEGHDSF